MDTPVKKNASYADLVDLPESVVGEIIDGDLYATPRPRLSHALVASAIAEQMRSGFGRREHGPGGWWIVAGPELHLGADVLVPDVAGWRRSRMPAVDPTAPWIELAPDWVCEVLSLTTARRDRAAKLPIYARAGVAHAWLVDPDAQALEVLQLERGAWVIAGAHRADQRVRLQPFDAAEIDLVEWWVSGAL